MTGPLSIALSGMTAAANRATTAAGNIARTNVETPETPQNQASAAEPRSDMITDIVDLQQASHAYQANAAVARVASQMDQELLNRFDETV